MNAPPVDTGTLDTAPLTAAPEDAGRPLQGRTACFHCGLDVDAPGRWPTLVDGEQREMCCAGCQAVAQAIVAAGLDDYYRHRSGPAAGPEAVPAELAALQVFDAPEVQARFVRDGGQSLETTLMLDGLRCGACVWLIERSLAAVPGVTAASVNFATERAVVRWDPARTRLSALLSRIAAVGYRAMPFDAQQREAHLARATKTLFRRLFVAGIGMMQVMMYAFPVYTAEAGDIDWSFEHAMRWASLVLTLPVVLYSAQPFFAGALRDLRARSLGMDVPVAIGVGTAFAASAWATVAGRGEVYFDSVTMFVFLLLGARYLEWIARRRASRAIDAVSAALPEQVERLSPDLACTIDDRTADPVRLAAISTETVPALRLAPGDLVMVANGARIPADGRIVAGSTAIDQSLLTGESIPVPRGVGDELAGGAINAGSPVYVRVLRSRADSALSTIERLIERAALEKPAIAELADRVAAWFVVALLLFAAGVLIFWWAVDAPRALPIAIAVLVVSCPCALSLATPAALAATTGAITRRGILLSSGRALESMATCTDVVFDKTGTLTEGRPRLVHTETFRDHEIDLGADAALALAAALESGSAHPLAAALVQAATERAAEERDAPARTPTASSIAVHPGLGVAGVVDGRALRLGAYRFATDFGDESVSGELDRGDDGRDRGDDGPDPGGDTHDRGDAPHDGRGDTPAHARHTGTRAVASSRPAHSDPTPGSDDLARGSEVWLADARGPIARFVLVDALRADGEACVRTLQRSGLRVHLLSGDRPQAVEALAGQLHMTSWRAGASPADKLTQVRALQAQGRRVLMVGDGINDAPVLAAADASLAVGHATALARTAADTVLLSDRLAMIPELLGIARRTRSVIRQNLMWASLYNTVAIPAAAAGYVPPWLAAIGMSLSSLLVVGNALRLRLPARAASEVPAQSGAAPGRT